ncbi:SDR family NAD(P)-dependent oxidoreductase, partial [Streptomyces sp. NPDC050803]
EPMLAEFAEVARSITYSTATTPVVSNLHGSPTTNGYDAEYWVRHVREAVRFADGVRWLESQGTTRFVELGPDGVLLSMVQETVESPATTLVPLLRRTGSEPTAVLEAVSRLHVSGAKPDWSALWGEGPGTEHVDLPTYAFQRQRFWPKAMSGSGDVSAAGLVSAGHPLLGAVVTLAQDDGLILTGRLSLTTHPWLADHAVHDTVLVPGAALAEMAIHAGDHTANGHLTELTLHAPLALPEHGATRIQVTVGAPNPHGQHPITIHSQPENTPDAPWTQHASGQLSPSPAQQPDTIAAHEWPPPGAVPIDTSGLYDRVADAGYHYGPAFQGIQAAWQHEDTLYADVALPAELHQQAADFTLHPALFDAALQTALLRTDLGADTALPFSWEGTSVHADGATHLRVRVSPTGANSITLTATDPTGTPVLTIDRLLSRPASSDQLAATRMSGDAGLFRVDWVAVETGSDETGAVDWLDASTLVAGTEDDAGGVEEAVTAALHYLQAWLTDPANTDRRLAVLTDRAVTTPHDTQAPDLRHAAITGLIRTAQNEHPSRIHLIDTNQPTGPIHPDEPQLAIRNGQALAPRLTRTPDTETAAWPTTGTILITGGTGTLGTAIARHLATHHHTPHLLLISRQGPNAPEADQLREDLQALGSQVTITACDITNQQALAETLAKIPADHPLTGVIHTAGAVDDATLTALTDDQIRRVLRPKVQGALNLHALTQDLDLAVFALFSSAAGTFGSPGQANYAAANAALDALAQQRRQQGLPAVSLAWGLWKESSGLTSHLTHTDHTRIARHGLTPLTTPDALTLLDTALPHTHTLPLALNTTHLRNQAATQVPALLRALLPAARPAAGAHTTGVGGATFAERLAALSATEREQTLLDLVRTHAATVLGHSRGHDINPEHPFRDLGFDSLTAVELRNQLAAATGLALPATLVFDYPTARGLARHLAAQTAGDKSDRTPLPTSAPLAVSDDDPIAIVGMSCRFPGDVNSPEDLWELLAAGGDAIADFPTDRGWDLESLYDPTAERPGTSYTREGGFLYNAADFDAGFFGISPREALAMDPQQRLLLEVSWEAFERTGIDPRTLHGSKAGVYVGAIAQEYGSLLAQASESDQGYLATATTPSVLSGRISYVLGLEGPALTVDTACSSSLVALHLAAQALRRGECDLALVGGVTVMSTPSLFVEFSRQRGLAADGRCKAFGSTADGAGWGEGAGVVVVERLSDAVRAGHQVLAVVRGSAVNQDGASNGLTAPNGPSQERVIRDALAAAGITPADIDAVEAHGTGTRLGDPIEAGALLNTYGRQRGEHPLYLGSLKSNIGHTQAAAGVGGVIKMVMALRRGVLPKTLHVDEPSPHVDWSAGDVELLTEQRPWPEIDRSRRAGVSSFGISGTNAHVILEQAPTAERELESVEPPLDLPAVPCVLSARDGNALREQAQRLLDHLDTHPELELGQLAWSLATTRTTFDHRATILATDRNHLIQGLTALASGEPAPHVVEGTAASGRIVFVFPGQGSQWPGMTLDLL